MRTLSVFAFVVCVFSVPAGSFAQKVSDYVVVIQDTEIKVGDKVLEKVTRGLPLAVLSVQDDWLWVSNEATGWVKKQYTTTSSNAIAVFTEQIQQKPNDSVAYAARGMAWFAKDEFDNCISDYTDAIRLDPKTSALFTSMLYNNRSNALNNKHDYDKAVSDCTEAIRLNPGSPFAYYNRGNAWTGKHDYDKAINDYTEAIRLNPKYTNSYSGIAWLHATCPNARFQNGSKAVEYATKACALTAWKQPGSLDTLAAAYAESGDFESAVKWQTKARDLVSENQKADFQSRVDLYEADKPYREEPSK